MLRLVSFLFGSIAMALIGGCSSHPPLPSPEYVDLERFMGRWYVLGYTPILVDEQAHNAIEHYRLDEKNKIQTTYQFRDGGFDGELKTYTPVGWVHDKSTNAEWRMQFIWPFRSDYIILHLAELRIGKDQCAGAVVSNRAADTGIYVVVAKPKVTDLHPLVS